jgi:hypothetical protein
MTAKNLVIPEEAGIQRYSKIHIVYTSFSLITQKTLHFVQGDNSSVLGGTQNVILTPDLIWGKNPNFTQNVAN